MIKLENIVYTDSTNEIPLKLFNKTSIEIPDKGSIYLNTKHREKAISLFLMLTGKITPYSGEIHFEQEVRKDEFIYWDTFSKDSIELTVGDLLKSFPSYNQQERSGNEAVQQEAKISSSEDIDFLKLGLQIAIANRKKCIVLNVESLEKDALEEVISPFSHLLSIVVFVVDGGNEKQNIVRLDNKKDSYLARVSKISHSNLKKRPFKFAFSTFLNALFVMLTILFFSVRYNNVCRYEVSKLNSMGMKTAFIYDSQIHHSWKNVYLHTWNDTYGTRQSTEIIKSIDDERIRSAGGCKFNDLFLYDINIREDRTELDELGLEVDARLVNHVGSFGQKEGETYISSVLFDHLLQNGWRDEKGIHKLNEPGDIIGQVIDGRTIKGVYTTQWDKLYYSVLNKEGNYEKYSYILNRKSEFFALFTCDGSQINTVTSFVYLLSGNTTKDVLNLKRLNVKEKTGR